MRWVLLGLIVCFAAAQASAQGINAGFIEGLWFDREVIFADEPTRVYVAIRNNTGADLSGTVEFFINDERIERNNVSALDGRIIESWADWTPGFGEYKIAATLSRTELSVVGSTTQAVEVVSALAEKTVFVDYDTDNDGVGNTDDADDDNDGIRDVEEETNGTDPLDPEDPAPESTETEDAEGQEEATNEGEDAQREEEESRSDSSGDGNPAGLEQYLTDSRANTTLGAITNTIHNTKKKVDEYRDARNARLYPSVAGETEDETTKPEEPQTDASTSTPASDQDATTTAAENTARVGSDGFGEITRTEAQDKKGPGLFATILDLGKSLFSNLFTLFLFLFSLYLAHPVLVQLSLLFLILFLIVKVARRLGNRQNI